MNTAQSIAIVGIWIGVAISSFGASEMVVVVALFALFATMIVSFWI